MRPLKLKMSAFGPYADVQDIDFTELGDRSIFLIHGPTGAGKTSILDAICYALYGDTSGAERSGKSMRSQHASLDQLTEVTFDFELKGSRYRVYRVPEQERLKKSGTGITLQNAEASIYRLNEDGEELIQSGWNKVADEVKKIIGFESDQFRQVIMLPQGQFRRLLTADSKERQDILEKIFHTEMYRRIEDILKDEAKELKKSIEEKQSRREWNLSRAECNSIHQLEDGIASNKEKLKNISGILKEKGERVKSAQGILDKAKEGNRKLKEKDDALKTLNDLKLKITEYEKKNMRLSNARKAATLVETEKVAKKRSEDKREAEKNLELKIKELIIAENNYEILKMRSEAEEKKESEREALRKKAIELEGYIDRVKSLESSKKAADILKNDSEKALLNKQNIQKKLIRLQEGIETQRGLVKDASEYAVKAPVFEAEYNKLKTVHTKVLELGKLKRDMDIQLKSYKLCLDEYSEAEKDYIEKKREFLKLQEEWYKGQAALIALTLEDGKPCPVCGSIHHPFIAVSDQEIPTEEMIKSGNNALEALDKVRNQKKKALDSQEIEKGKLEGRIKALEDELEEDKETDIQSLGSRVNELKVSFEDASSRSSVLDKLQKQLKDMEDAEKTLKRDADEADGVFTLKNADYQKSLGVYKEKEESVPEDIRDLDSLQGHINDTGNKLKALADALDRAKKDLEDSVKLLTQAKTSKENAEKSIIEISEKYNQEREAFRQSMVNAGFEKYGDYENSKLDDVSILKLEDDIKEFNGSLKSAEDSYCRAENLASGIEFLELSALEQDLKAAEEEREAAVRDESSLSERIKNDKRVLEEVQKLDGQIKEGEERYKVLGQLSNITNGQNGYGITFQRFVLGALLDDITIAATERLKLMSKGRYFLRRTLDRARKNAAGGLDLEVFDTYTGLERSVTTLSGGESFLASLSLALGLADVVQSYSGGISLDTIFVDEGFGTLDPESLDFAIKTLVDLQKGGRLVGIISHVPELKERIDARLEVIPTDRGSSARFWVG